ncbi:MAG: BamA/TamA family outer membrane protein [Planctomycetota bacterium]
MSIEVVGNRRYSEAQLISALGQPLDRPLDPNAVSDGLQALWNTFRVRGEVGLQEVDGGLALRLDVVEMPFDLEPRFIGNVEVSSEELYEWARLEPDSELYLYQAPRIRERLLDSYRRDGFYFAEVSEVIREGGVDAEGRMVAPDVIFEIREGPQVHVRDVVIHGNRSMPDRGFLLWKDGLREFADIELAKPRLWLFKDEYDEDVLLGDLQAMREVYRERGWLDAVVQLDHLDFSADRGWVTIHVRIDEGPRYRVGSLRIEGFERYGGEQRDGTWPERRADLLFDEQKLLDLCDLEEGAYFEQLVMSRDARSITNHYGERGYVAHPSLPVLDRFDVLEPEILFEEDRPVAHVTYRLAQGRQQFVREILISGNTNTQDRIIRGRITVEPGQVADLPKIARSRSRIQALGFFSDDRPQVEHTEPYFLFRETDDPAWKDLEYIIDETNALGFSASGGVSSNTGLFGIFSLQKQNFDLFDVPSSLGSAINEIADGRAFHGAGQTLRFLVAPGTQTSSFEIRFREPDIFRRHTDRIGLDLLARRRLRIFESHDETREEYGASLRYQVGPDSYVNAGYTFGKVEVEDLSAGGEPTLGNPLTVPQLLKDQEGEDDLAWIDLSYDYSALDDFFYPQNGSTFSAGFQIYNDALGSDYDFVKTSLSWQKLGQFGEESPDARPGYKLELDLGVATPYGDTDDVPYSERYFLGGQRTLRGFDFRGVGPNENRFPIGGQTFTAFSAEYRRPLIKNIQPGSFREIEVIRGGLFFDAGILDPDDWSLDPDELRASAGVFIGLTVPIAFTFSFGFPVREGDGDDTQVFQFNIGF